MTDIKYRDRILEAIDQLRLRKARPDIRRICNFLLKRFSISFNDARADLQKCVDNDIVLKVEYKGSISYRNAAKKFSHLKKDSNGRIESTGNEKFKIKRKFSALLNNAIAELIVQEPDYLEIGVPGDELIQNILSKDNVKYTTKYVSILIEKEIENGGLIRMDNGNYLVGPARSNYSNNYYIEDNKKMARNIEKRGDNNEAELMFFKNDDKQLLNDEENEEITIMDKKDRNCFNQYGNLRVGSRRKRAKKVFDPSDNNLPRKRGRPAGSLNKSTVERQHGNAPKINIVNETRPDSQQGNSREQGGVCSVCHNNTKGLNDRFVSCRECSNKAHFSCLNGDDNMMLRMYPDSSWQCPHCKTCVICFETSDAGNLIVCSICADAYHARCHQPRITEKIRNGTKWLCMNCQMPEQLAINDIQSHVITGETEKIISINRLHRKSPSPSASDNSSHGYRSLQPSPTPPTLSPQANHNGEISPDFKSNHSDSQSFNDLDMEENIDPSIPDATSWTYDDVYNYFAQYFPNEARVFKEQEIDGRSLLLMRRMDVLTSLKLKLGPALKIYRHVVKLQHRRDDPKLYWL